MSDEEDDYMSCAFLDTQEDIRPGLLAKSAKRKLDIHKKQVESNKVFRTKSRKELEEESRSIGLNSALGSENKGFAMLQKMGYKPGMKLGSEKSSSTFGLKEPIQVKIKMDRGGLGREDAIRRKIEQREERREKLKVYREHETKILTEEFRERMCNKVDDKRLTGDLRNCQKICEQLDAEDTVKEPMRPWFWYSQERKSEEELNDEEEEYEEITPEEKIDFITEYLRRRYFYCVWCCIKYNDEEDLLQNCPGPDKSSHDDDL